MKKYDKIMNREMIVCNCCGQVIAPYDDCRQTDFLSVRKAWGYFSKWDGCMHSFDICMDCYEKLSQAWVYPPETEGMTELL